MNTFGLSPSRRSDYPFSNKVVLDDPLKDNSRGYQWSEFRREVSCYFSAGAYHVSTPGASVMGAAQRTSFLNFTYQIDMTIIKGEEGGILCRLNDEGGFPHFASFTIDKKGDYKVSAFNDYGIGITHPSSSNMIKKGLNQSNTIAVVVRNNSITLYVNGHEVESKSGTNLWDTIPLTRGHVGVIANHMFTENPSIATEIAFRNAKVWEL